MFRFCDPNSFIIKNILNFHNYVIIIVIIISIIVLYIIFIIFIIKFKNLYFINNQHIELIWTILPIIYLIILVIPSLNLLYLYDEIHNKDLTVKVIGHQWYWRYEIPGINIINFDSYILNNDDIIKNSFRLLDCDNRLVLPFNLWIQFLISRYDVIHSFTIISAGLKVDAVPGRLNQVIIKFDYPIIIYGQCSEICGINHRFIPIKLEVVNLNYFLKWYLNFKN